MDSERTRMLMNEGEMEKAIHRLAKEIVSDDTDNVALIGIKTRGVPLAEWIAGKIESIQHKPIQVGSLDIQMYRDDLSEVSEHPVIKRSDLAFSVTGKGILLVDDVLYTGRTIRAAMDAIVDFGRPRFIKLVVMVDRGWRELPIQADYIGKRIRTTANENVKVKFEAIDGVNEVLIRG